MDKVRVETQEGDRLSGRRLVLEQKMEFVAVQEHTALVPVRDEGESEMAAVPRRVREALEALVGYEWVDPARAEEAAEHFDAARHAHAHGLPEQRDRHLKELRELWELDDAHRSVQVLRRQGVGAKLFAVRSSTGEEAFRVAGADFDWFFRRVEETDELLPAEALRALSIARGCGIRYDGAWVGVPCSPTLGQVVRHDVRRGAAAVSKAIREYGPLVAGAAVTGATVVGAVLLAPLAAIADPLLAVSLHGRYVLELTRWR